MTMEAGDEFLLPFLMLQSQQFRELYSRPSFPKLNPFMNVLKIEIVRVVIILF